MVKAKESSQVQKARKKLEKRLAEEDKRVNAQALVQMKQTIKRWLSRHGGERVELKERVDLFDENRHSANVKSKYVQHLLADIKNEHKKIIKPLAGRIKK